MNIEAYVFTINRNSSYRLDSDELKDVQQDINLYLTNKQYNDEMLRKTVLSFFLRAINKKKKNEEIVSSGVYMESHDPGTHELETERMDLIGKLTLNDTQKKIVELLVRGFEYKEIRKKLKLNPNQLRNQVKRIRQTNTAGANSAQRP